MNATGNIFFPLPPLPSFPLFFLPLLVSGIANQAELGQVQRFVQDYFRVVIRQTEINTCFYQ